MSTATVNETFYKGSLVHLAATFATAAGAAIDPTVVKFQYKKPAGTALTLTYGTDAALQKSATGAYYVDLDADTVGTWYFKWYSTGTGQAAVESSFVVNKTKF